MKKVLLASTVLAMTATVAAADVTVSGNARMGVVYNGNADDNKLQFANRIRVIFTMSGETDSGLSFGASVRADQAAGANRGGNGGTVFISGAFGTLTMGDVVGAAESVVGDLPEVGFQDLSDQNDTIFLTGDGEFYQSDRNPGVLYTYSTGGLTFALGMNDGRAEPVGPSFGVTGDLCLEDLDPTLPEGNCVTLAQPADLTNAYSVGVKYAVDAYAFSLGYEVADFDEGESAKHLVLGAEATFGDVNVKAVYGDGSGAISDLKHYGLGASYNVDALTVHGFIRRVEVGEIDVNTYGVGAAYALGGGASIQGGLVDDDLPGTKVRADLGVKFTF